MQSGNKTVTKGTRCILDLEMGWERRVANSLEEECPVPVTEA